MKKKQKAYICIDMNPTTSYREIFVRYEKQKGDKRYMRNEVLHKDYEKLREITDKITHELTLLGTFEVINLTNNVREIWESEQQAIIRKATEQEMDKLNRE